MDQKKKILGLLALTLIAVLAVLFLLFKQPPSNQHTVNDNKNLSDEIAAPPAPEIDRSQEEAAPQSRLEASPEKETAPSDVIIPTDGFAPHKALYDIKITRLKSGSPVTGVSGDMFYKWSDECVGYATDHRFNIRYDYAEQPAVRISSRYIAFENKASTEMSYVSIHDENGSEREEIRGMAKRQKDNTGEAVNTMPKGLRFTLPENFVFPTQHTKAVLAQAVKGNKFYAAVMYDGSDAEGPIEINAVIGKEIKPVLAPQKDEVDARLLNNRAWPVRLAFFKYLKDDKMADEDIKPLYEMDIILHENGVVSAIDVDYDSFSVRQDLTALTALPMKKGCE
jgi:hypothetical protein